MTLGVFESMSWFFFPSDLANIGAEGSPAVVTSWSDAHQTIGMITLRLQPPSKIDTWWDYIYIFWNHEFLRVVIGLIWLLVCGFIESFLAQLSDIRYVHTPYDKHPLADLLHDAFPRVENYQTVNYLLMVTLLYTLLAFALQLPDWVTRWIVLRRWCFIMGAIYVFRGITLVVTTLPSPLFDDCQPPAVVLSGSVGDRFAFLFTMIGGNAVSCTDNIFSGHTAAITSCAMVWRIHSRLRRWFSWVAYLIVLVTVLMLVFTRFHYTVDVLLALFITYAVWNMYTRYIQDASIRYMFGYTHRTTLDMFQRQLETSDAALIYEHLNWQPHPLGQTWIMWICLYADGLDIRLRVLGVFDEFGTWRSRHPPNIVDVHEMTRTNPIYHQSLPI